MKHGVDESATLGDGAELEGVGEVDSERVEESARAENGICQDGGEEAGREGQEGELHGGDTGSFGEVLGNSVRIRGRGDDGLPIYDI